eukprot:1160492-Pelagomonas_calceolata.AAC.5
MDGRRAEGRRGVDNLVCLRGLERIGETGCLYSHAIYAQGTPVPQLTGCQCDRLTLRSSAPPQPKGTGGAQARKSNSSEGSETHQMLLGYKKHLKLPLEDIVSEHHNEVIDM